MLRELCIVFSIVKILRKQGTIKVSELYCQYDGTAHKYPEITMFSKSFSLDQIKKIVRDGQTEGLFAVEEIENDLLLSLKDDSAL